MDLPAFIRSKGVEEAAKVLGENERTVKAWMYRERYPRRETAAKIVERTNGEVSLTGIYGQARQ